MKTSDDNRNLLLAIVLSVIVLIGWNFFYAVPQMDKQKQISQQNQAAQQVAPGAVPGASPGAPLAPGAPPVPGSPATTPTPAGAAPVGVTETREVALARSPRIAIDTPKVFGSVALIGGRIDDVSLKAYRETVDPKSANIVLLSPAGSPTAYYADFGWVAAPGETVTLPSVTTRWTTTSTTLTPESPAVLTWDNGQGLIFKRTISVDANAMFSVKDDVDNKSATPVSLLPYGLVTRFGKPATLGFYVLHEGMIGVLGEQGLQEYTYDAVEKEPLLNSATRGKVWKDQIGGFIGITDKYWATALIPDQSRKYEGRFHAIASAAKAYEAVFVADPVAVAPGASATSSTRLFAGAKEVAAVDGYEQSLGIKRFDLLIDWGWFYFITKPMFKVMDWIYHRIGNFGVAILIITVLLKLIFFPLASKSYASMAKMKAVQPEMLAIRERFADDKMKQQQALMELYKKEKINPIAGCWPVLLQIPVFFALYKILFVTIEMRHAPFFGWIQDLAAPDPTSLFNLFGLLPYNVPHFLMIGVWPIIMGITMFVQMKMNPEPTDPAQKLIFTWMPVFFTFLLGSFPAGLVIYWSWNNLLSVTQQGYIMKKNGVKIELWDNIIGLFRKKPEVKPAGVKTADVKTSEARTADVKTVDTTAETKPAGNKATRTKAAPKKADKPAT